MITRTPARPARLAAVALALLLGAGASACGTSSGDEKADKASTTTEADGTTTTADDGTTTTTEDEGASTSTSEGGDETTTTVGDPGDASAQDYVDALVGQLANIYGTDGQSECIAEGTVDVLGAERIADAGIAPGDFGEGDDDIIETLEVSEGEASDIFDLFDSCDVDLAEVFLSIYGQNPTPQQEACVDEILNDDALRASFIADYLGEELENDPIDNIDDCFPDAAGSSSVTPQTVVPAN